MFTRNRLAFAVLAVGIVSACTRESESVNDLQVAARIPSDTTTATPTMDMVDSATGMLARRVEAQQYFDDARTAMTVREPERARTSLLAASAFLRQQSDSAAGTVRDELRMVARDIDTIAAAVGGKRDVAMRRLDHAFARANLAESDRHLARAMAAWTSKDSARTADELIMAADHLERAAKDGRVPASTARTEATAAARALATDLLSRGPTPPERMSRTHDALQAASRALHERLKANVP